MFQIVRRNVSKRLAVASFCVALSCLSTDTIDAQNSEMIVISEIMYNPAGQGRDGDDDYDGDGRH